MRCQERIFRSARAVLRFSGGLYLMEFVFYCNEAYNYNVSVICKLNHESLNLKGQFN